MSLTPKLRLTSIPFGSVFFKRLLRRISPAEIGQAQAVQGVLGSLIGLRIGQRTDHHSPQIEAVTRTGSDERIQAVGAQSFRPNPRGPFFNHADLQINLPGDRLPE